MEWNIIICAACAVLGAAFSYAAFSRNKEQDDKNDGQQTGVMLTELGYIKGSVDTINGKMDRQEGRILDLVSRMSAVEASAKSAHHRIDRLEGVESHEAH